MSGIFETLQKFMEMGNDPRLMEAADGIGKASQAIPDLLAKMVKQQEMTNINLCSVIEELQGMRMDLDRIADPIKRPPFSALDVQAAMEGRWPADPEPPVLGNMGFASKPHHVEQDWIDETQGKGPEHGESTT